MTPRMLCDVTGLKLQTIYNRINTGGDLPPIVRLGRSLRWRDCDVQDWIAKKIEAPLLSASPVIKSAAPRRRGRPTKAEQIAARKMRNA